MLWSPGLKVLVSLCLWLSSGSGVGGQLSSSSGSCYKGGRRRDGAQAPAAPAGERQIRRAEGSRVRTGRAGQRSGHPVSQTAGHHDHSDRRHPGQEELQTQRR